MLVSSTFRIALSSLLFGEHNWDIGFCRVGCVFAMLIDVSFDATLRRSSRSIRQSLSLTILMENQWKMDRRSRSNVVLHRSRLDNRSWERFCLHFISWGCFWELLGDFGRPWLLPWATLGRSRGALGGSWASPGAPRGPSGDPPGTLLGSREPRGMENHNF